MAPNGDSSRTDHASWRNLDHWAVVYNILLVKTFVVPNTDNNHIQTHTNLLD